MVDTEFDTEFDKSHFFACLIYFASVSDCQSVCVKAALLCHSTWLHTYQDSQLIFTLRFPASSFSATVHGILKLSIPINFRNQQVPHLAGGKLLIRCCRHLLNLSSFAAIRKIWMAKIPNCRYAICLPLAFSRTAHKLASRDLYSLPRPAGPASALFRNLGIALQSLLPVPAPQFCAPSSHPSANAFSRVPDHCPDRENCRMFERPKTKRTTCWHRRARTEGIGFLPERWLNLEAFVLVLPTGDMTVSDITRLFSGIVSACRTAVRVRLYVEELIPC